MKKIVLLMLVVLLTGCTVTWKKTDSKEYIDKHCKFAAYLPVGWMYFPGVKEFNTTRDGVALDSILVELVKFNEKLSSTKKQFKSSMLVNDLAEVDIDNYRSNPQVLHFEVLENKIISLDGKDAYRFVFRYQTPEGLKRKAIVCGVAHGETLYRIVYMAAEQHYFDLYQNAFESFVKSFRFS